jgi:hypothetical protein
MHIDRTKLETTRQTLLATIRRAQDIVINGGRYREFPNSCSEGTIRFAQTLARSACTLVSNACNEVGLSEYSLDKPVSDDLLQSLEWQVGKQAQDLGQPESDIENTRFAAARALADAATELVERAERCLEGKETLAGQPIRRGPLYDK